MEEYLDSIIKEKMSEFVGLDDFKSAVLQWMGEMTPIKVKVNNTFKDTVMIIAKDDSDKYFMYRFFKGFKWNVSCDINGVTADEFILELIKSIEI